MEFKQQIVIDRPINDVWDILGNQYGQAYLWASGLSHSEGAGAPKHAKAPCSQRVCTTTQGTIKETVDHFDAENYQLVYTVIEGFPFFVDRATNHWTLEAQGQQTLVHMHLMVQTKGWFGALMRPIMKGQLQKTVAPILNDLKVYVETGQPSAHKQQELQRQAA